MAKALLVVWEGLSENDQTILKHLSARVRAGWNDLHIWSQQAQQDQIVALGEAEETHPVVNTLIECARTALPPPGVRLLIALMCETALSPYRPETRTRKLSSKIRGAMEIRGRARRNDLPMLLADGLGIAYRPKPVLEEALDNCIIHGDLTAALYAQGFRTVPA